MLQCTDIVEKKIVYMNVFHSDCAPVHQMMMHQNPLLPFYIQLIKTSRRTHGLKSLLTFPDVAEQSLMIRSQVN